MRVWWERRFRRIAFLLVAFLLTCLGQAWGTTESQLKAAVVFNIGKFVEWPPAAFSSSNAPLLLGVPERDAMADTLETLNGKVVQGRQLLVKKTSRIEDLKKCQVVYLSNPETAGAILSNLKGLPILSITDNVSDFARLEGIINITVEEGKIRLQVNLGAANRSNLTINSQLLKLAKVVNISD